MTQADPLELTDNFISFLATRELTESEIKHGGERLQLAFQKMAAIQSEEDCTPDIWAAIQTVKKHIARVIQASDLLRGRITAEQLFLETDSRPFVTRDLDPKNYPISQFNMETFDAAVEKINEVFPILAPEAGAYQGPTDKTVRRFFNIVEIEIGRNRLNEKWGGTIFTRDPHTLSLG